MNYECKSLPEFFGGDTDANMGDQKMLHYCNSINAKELLH